MNAHDMDPRRLQTSNDSKNVKEIDNEKLQMVHNALCTLSTEAEKFHTYEETSKAYTIGIKTIISML